MISHNASPGQPEQGPSQPINVGMQGWEKTTAESPIIQTHGLGPCIGIAIYNPADKVGHLAHIATPGAEQQTIADFLSSATDNGAAAQNLQVWVRGGQVNRQNAGSEFIGLFGRQSLVEGLTAAGISAEQMNVEWDENPVESQGTRMKLDATTGEFQSLVAPAPHVAQAIGQEALMGERLTH
ncbi:MAG: hypothetical protein JWP13_637 [Candidatus Saccharibacteria bacterium]|nr:hypothetical protein [Candidatus Saccharibacteria bacterium]